MYPVVCTVLRTVSLSRNRLTINYHSVCGKHAIAGTRTTVPAVSENVKRANDRPWSFRNETETVHRCTGYYVPYGLAYQRGRGTRSRVRVRVSPISRWHAPLIVSLITATSTRGLWLDSTNDRPVGIEPWRVDTTLVRAACYTFNRTILTLSLKTRTDCSSSTVEIHSKCHIVRCVVDFCVSF